MTNEEKAKHLSSREMYGGFTLAEQNAAYDAAMAMAEWKDEKHAQEKQQLIDEACKWLFENDSYAIPTNVQVDGLREHLNKMKGDCE